jgi:hypothetical protein
MSPEEFAKIAVEYLRAQGETRPIEHDGPRDQLVVGAPPQPVSFIFLGHARKEYGELPRAERERVLGRRLWATVHRAEADTLEQLKRGVLPRLRDRAWFSAVRRQAELELGADEDAIDELMLPHQPLNEELAVHLAFELPTSVTEIGSDRLAAWGIDFRALLEQAKDNLRRRSVLAFEEAAPGVFLSPFRDTFDATRLVLPELFRALEVRGTPVVLAPTHDSVFVAGDGDPGGLMQIAIYAEEALTEPRANSATAFRLEGDAWRPWLPPRQHLAWPKFKMLSLQTLASAYSRQKEVLDALLQANGHEIAVATLRAFRTAAGDVFTATAWLQDTEALLPQTDRIDFVKVGADGTPDANQVWSTSFDVARRTLGELMQPIGDLPERWRVRGFPTLEQLEAMAHEGQLAPS